MSRSPNGAVLYWRTNLPQPTGRKDYVYRRWAHPRAATLPDGTALLGVVSESLLPGEAQMARAPMEGVLRIEAFASVWCVWAAHGTNCPSMECALLYFEDPKIPLPDWLTDKFTGTGMSGFLQLLYHRTKAYPPERLRVCLAAAAEVPPRADGCTRPSASAPAEVGEPRRRSRQLLLVKARRSNLAESVKVKCRNFLVERMKDGRLGSALDKELGPICAGSHGNLALGVVLHKEPQAQGNDLSSGVFDEEPKTLENRALGAMPDEQPQTQGNCAVGAVADEAQTPGMRALGYGPDKESASGSQHKRPCTVVSELHAKLDWRQQKIEDIERCSTVGHAEVSPPGERSDVTPELRSKLDLQQQKIVDAEHNPAVAEFQTGEKRSALSRRYDSVLDELRAKLEVQQQKIEDAECNVAVGRVPVDCSSQSNARLPMELANAGGRRVTEGAIMEHLGGAHFEVGLLSVSHEPCAIGDHRAAEEIFEKQIAKVGVDSKEEARMGWERCKSTTRAGEDTSVVDMHSEGADSFRSAGAEDHDDANSWHSLPQEREDRQTEAREKQVEVHETQIAVYQRQREVQDSEEEKLSDKPLEVQQNEDDKSPE